MKKLIIGLGTYRRPNMLADALDSLSKLDIPEGIQASLVVADNDPDKSAESTVEEFADKFKNLDLIYILAKERGIVHMRNEIVQYALDHKADFLAFLDDDEEVTNDWLEKMLSTKEKYNADVVVGRVARTLPKNTPKWIKHGKFFERPSIPTGTIRKAASTSNVLFDLLKLCEDFGLRFHRALNLVGSSDTHFFSTATQKGAKIVWLNEDLVSENIPKSRMTVKWQLNRAFRHTNCRTVRKRISNSYSSVLFSESIYGIAHFLLGIFSFPINIFRGKAGIVHTLRFFWKGAGSFAGLVGYKFEEYRNVHGN